jgi:hypothetical protein
MPGRTLKDKWKDKWRINGVRVKLTQKMRDARASNFTLTPFDLDDKRALNFNQERIGNHHVFDFLAMLLVFRIQG